MVRTVVGLRFAVAMPPECGGGYAPPSISYLIFGGYAPGRSPFQEGVLTEGRSPSSHRAAKPRRFHCLDRFHAAFLFLNPTPTLEVEIFQWPFDIQISAAQRVLRTSPDDRAQFGQRLRDRQYLSLN